MNQARLGHQHNLGGQSISRAGVSGRLNNYSQYFGYDLAQPKKSRGQLVVYDVDHDDATTAAKALTEFVASSSFTECLRHGGRGDARARRARRCFRTATARRRATTTTEGRPRPRQGRAAYE